MLSHSCAHNSAQVPTALAGCATQSRASRGASVSTGPHAQTCTAQQCLPACNARPRAAAGEQRHAIAHLQSSQLRKSAGVPRSRDRGARPPHRWPGRRRARAGPPRAARPPGSATGTPPARARTRARRPPRRPPPAARSARRHLHPSRVDTSARPLCPQLCLSGGG